MNSKKVSAAGVHKFRRWIVESIRENKPYDEFVAELLSAFKHAWADNRVAAVIFTGAGDIAHADPSAAASRESAGAARAPRPITPETILGTTAVGVFQAPAKLITWSNADCASRIEPSPDRAIICNAASSTFTFSASAISLKRSKICACGIFLKMNSC